MGLWGLECCADLTQNCKWTHWNAAKAAQKVLLLIQALWKVWIFWSEFCWSPKCAKSLVIPHYKPCAAGFSASHPTVGPHMRVNPFSGKCHPFFPRYSCGILSSCNTEKCIAPFKTHSSPQESELPKSQPSAPQFQHPHCGIVHTHPQDADGPEEAPIFWREPKKKKNQQDRKRQLTGTL